jgi:hypothetical protein
VAWFGRSLSIRPLFPRPYPRHNLMRDSSKVNEIAPKFFIFFDMVPRDYLDFLTYQNGGVRSQASGVRTRELAEARSRREKNNKHAASGCLIASRNQQIRKHEARRPQAFVVCPSYFVLCTSPYTSGGGRRIGPLRNQSLPRLTNTGTGSARSKS